jgi:hypothetical protein
MDKEKEMQENTRRNRYCNVDLGGQKMSGEKMYKIIIKAVEDNDSYEHVTEAIDYLKEGKWIAYTTYVKLGVGTTFIVPMTSVVLIEELK